MLKLTYLPANAAYVFVFGDTPLKLANAEQMFYPERATACREAIAHGLAVRANGDVEAEGPNPFEA